MDVISDKQAEDILSKSTGQRVTKQAIENRIESIAYMVIPDTTVTICHISLDNGFSVRGESACVDPSNFNKELGEKYSYENAFEKLWAFFGFLLAENLNVRVDRIARVCHEVNKAYCEALGDSSQLAWEDCPEWQKSSARLGVELHLGNHDAGAAASHASWYAQKDAEGWVWGPVKDPERKQHPCMVAFEDLPREQQAKDYIFRGVVLALADY